ncbi:hypothetical protein Q4F19_15540 [Sphingomonas sp. BIUV-7]|uniref:DUF11 domain-containing protein n=1 Tax=Sphingomonas natans TaxID=3063330 RepID=A0ABT8YBU9_9SPHN|nr:hypothetical protein [Sphingomonas sp. BIUV-7]MDO6415804.1 hypothetical protein [Sphingomonas sp. BIUV-7]
MLRSLTIAAVALGAFPAVAAGPLEVTSRVMVEAKQRADDGSTRVALLPARRVVPGDRVVFVLAYRNVGRQPLSDIVLDNPVPAGLAYRAPAQGSAVPDVSIDGKTYGALAALRVPVAGGSTRAATAEDVTNVRWRIDRPIAAGTQGQFAFQAILR